MNGIKKTNGYNFLPHDFLTLFYVIIIIFIVLTHYNSLSFAYMHIFTHLLGVAFIFLIAKYDRNKNKLITLIHYFYPILFFTFIYQETGRLNQLFYDGYFDKLLLYWDTKLFGKSPIYWFYELIPQRIISEYFHFSYAFYYLMVPLTFVYIYKRKKDNVLHYMFTLCFSFYIYYLIFIFFPAVGGRTFADIYAREGYLFKKIVDYIYLTQEIDGGAFPSSHVGIALVCLLNLKRVGGYFYKIMLILVPSLALATVYCGYHYGVDMITGWISGYILYKISSFLYVRYFSN
ncbi:conserved hypothetical protein [Deferribacter desulfuricans SSM1]|uniref:Inositolphosphotransferase Aur1/Ipt1 domain-containing protein n=1 Tax=Deferribacter desulfuricans (strain DSM 14783 / JCM 11476 / NBRC 101012 / SSM1) TaxID=639282 RepID=D3PDD0_DEFDS|nr:phosphatase PAP2 family protein [Deferribacter desulfuricans]BAI80603.1 conserved hypothetical protein [Deferribacter desulfuricans SSM1]